MDRRVIAQNKQKTYQNINSQRMTADVVLSYTDEETDEGVEETIEVHIKFEVCLCCMGRGTVVNPNIDAHGISREDMDADPEFAEAYMTGVYDISCPECEGRRVVPVCTDEKMLKRIRQQERENYECARETCYARERGY